ncbi:MAG: class I SAM-dependent methyltransferase [Candidatus Fermentibacter sp.]|nr:class I SAM-dependent methyltransferase [Candidatus Fermentibacter sp.]
MVAGWQDDYRRLLNEAARLVGSAPIAVDVGGGDGSGLAGNIGGNACRNVLSLDRCSDMHPDIVADAHFLPFRPGSIDAILCFSVLEHLEDPHAAVREIHGALSAKGAFIGYVPFLYPFHGSPSDHSRYTSTGLMALLSRFRDVHCAPWGDYLLVLIGFMTGFDMRLLRALRPVTGIVSSPIRSLFRTASRKRSLGRSYSESTIGHLFIARK